MHIARPNWYGVPRIPGPRVPATGEEQAARRETAWRSGDLYAESRARATQLTVVPTRTMYPGFGGEVGMVSPDFECNSPWIKRLDDYWDLRNWFLAVVRVTWRTCKHSRVLYVEGDLPGMVPHEVV